MKNLHWWRVSVTLPFRSAVKIGHPHSTPPLLLHHRFTMQAKDECAKPHLPTFLQQQMLHLFIYLFIYLAQTQRKSVKRGQRRFRRMEICSWEVVLHPGDSSCASKKNLNHLQTERGRKKTRIKGLFMLDTSTYTCISAAFSCFLPAYYVEEEVLPLLRQMWVFEHGIIEFCVIHSNHLTIYQSTLAALAYNKQNVQSTRAVQIIGIWFWFR